MAHCPKSGIYVGCVHLLNTRSRYSGKAETPVLSLTLLIKRIRDDDPTVGGLAATRIERPEVYDDRWCGCRAPPLQIDRRHGERAGNPAYSIVHEKAPAG